MAEQNDVLDTDDKRRLNLTLSTRETIINELMSKGLPEATSDRVTLMQALDGLDRTVLAKAKIKSDDAAHKNQQQATKVIGDLLSRFTVKSTDQIRTEAPIVPDDAIALELVPGETGNGDANLTYDNFMHPAV